MPFCVICGTAMVEGRGERLRKLPDMPDCIFVICKPEFSVSTPELYRKLDETTIGKRPDNRAMESALLAGDLEKVCQNVFNVFDPVVTAEHNELNYIKSLLHQSASLKSRRYCAICSGIIIPRFSSPSLYDPAKIRPYWKYFRYGRCFLCSNY